MKLPSLASRFLPLKKKAEAEQLQEITRICRRVLCDTVDGAIVLSVLLDDLHWNAKTTLPEDVALRNFATFFLQKRLGIMNDTLAAVSAVINTEVHKETKA
jgi:uncharacterized membrane protein